MKARDVLGLLRLEDGRKWVDAAHDWQRTDALAVLEGEEPYSFVTRSRGSSKTTDLAACALSDLVAAEERLRCYWLASDSEQGGIAIDTIEGFTGRTPGLAARVEVQARRVLVPETGATLTVLPADAAGAFGLLPHRLYVDEFAHWDDTDTTRRLWDATSSSVAKRDDARMCVLTTASTPDHPAFKVLEHARTSPLWRTSERDGPSPWISEERLAEQRARLPQAVYEQLWLNRWVAAEGSFLDPTALAAAFTLDSPSLQRRREGGYVAGLDLGSVNDRTVLAICHREGDELLLDRMQTWQGTRAHPVNFGEVEEFIVEAHRRYGFELRLDPWQGLDLARRLRDRNVRASEFNFSPASKQRLAQTLLSTINAGKLRLYDAEGLRDELLALRLVQSTAGTWAFDHKRSGHDDRATALSLALVALLERAGGELRIESTLDLPAHMQRIPETRPGRGNPDAGAGGTVTDKGTFIPDTHPAIPPGTPAWMARRTRRVLREQPPGGGR
jgi:phage terminase large subunit-like protein